MLKNFRTYLAAVEFYKQAKTLPLKGAPKEQLSRASLSISLNLVEGSGKSSQKDKIRYYEIAMGSTRECQAILTVEDLVNTPAWSTLDNLAGSLYLLIKRAT